ncbi:MAG: hypothetical protein J0M26_00710 [Planctomycetes bacterium]|nr:hypothetical protein [Planctomycetota bacterium]
MLDCQKDGVNAAGVLCWDFKKTPEQPLAFNVWFVHNYGDRNSHVHTGITIPTTADHAKSIYLSNLKETLERDHKGEYVAIASPTRRHYIRPTFLETAMAAREAEPNDVPFVIRIGYDAAFHIGATKT